MKLPGKNAKKKNIRFTIFFNSVFQLLIFTATLSAQLVTKIIPTDGVTGDYFGSYVSLSENYAVISTQHDDNQKGAVYIFKRNGTQWEQQAKLTASDRNEGDRFGRVAIEGNLVAVGAPNKNEVGPKSGAVYIFQRNGMHWSEQAKLIPGDAGAGDGFGHYVAIRETIIVIGAADDDESGEKSGSAYVFEFNGTNWVEQAKLVASDGAKGDRFGNRVAIFHDRIAVGAYLDDDNGRNSGSVYIFKWDGTTWQEEAKIIAADGAEGDQFGCSLVFDGKCLVAGARYDDDNGFNSGSAYVFTRNGSKWTEQAKLLPGDGAVNGTFGHSLAICQNLIVVGAATDYDNGPQSGSVYLFKRNGSSWREEAKLLAPDGKPGDCFGGRVAIYQDYLLIGAGGNDATAINSGAAYIYNFNSLSKNQKDEKILRESQRGFQKYQIRTGSKAKSQLANIYDFHQDEKGLLWLATLNQGLYRFDTKREVLVQYKNRHSLPQGNQFTAILCLQPDRLLLGTNGAGLVEFNTRQKIFSPLKIDQNTADFIRSLKIIALLQDAAENIWVTTRKNGLLCFDPKLERFHQFTHARNNAATLSSNSTTAILADRQGNLWVGTANAGLNKLSAPQCTKAQTPAQYSFVRYQHQAKNPKCLSSNAVTGLWEDCENGLLWIATRGRGLNQFNPETGQFKHFTEADSLLSNSIAGMQADKDGNLWLSTGAGISKFNPQTEKFSNHDVATEFLAKDFHPGAACKSADGRIFFGKSNGFIFFDPPAVQADSVVPRVILTGFNLYGAQVRTDTVLAQKKVVLLDYTQKVFSFDFSLENYNPAKKYQFAYRMEGFDADWIYTGAYRQAHFTNLNPGEYLFRVKAANTDGIWNEEGTSITVIITPPWWRTWWAYALYLIGVSALVFAFWRFHARRMKLRDELQKQRFEAEKLQEIDRMKSRFFSNISHEFRTPLTLILGPLDQLLNNEITGNRKTYYKMMFRSARRLERLINQLLELSKVEAGQMALSVVFTDISRAVKGWGFSFESLAERKGIHLKFIAPDTPVSGFLDYDKVEKIISNLLSNAFKFTRSGGEVTVEISTINQPENANSRIADGGKYIQLVVTDTGPGIASDRLQQIFDRFYQVDDSMQREQEGTGIGLALVKELVSVYRGVILVDSKLGQGTRFCVQLPIDRNCFREHEIKNPDAGQAIPSAPQVVETEPGQADVVAAGQIPAPFKIKKGRPKPATVLVVEDNPDVVKYIRFSISDRFRVVSAENGITGLEKAIKIIPDLIISDVMMPKMDGFEFCAKIKTDERTSHIPVILLTARAGMEDKIEGLETGADDYLIKPFNIKELQVRMNNLIAQRAQLRERFQRDANLPLSELAVTPVDEQFLNRINTVVQQNLTAPQFGVEKMAREVGMSRAQLHRKLNALSNQSPGAFLRIMRLRHSARMLSEGAGNVTEVALEVGYNNLSHFAKSFQEHFGVLPSEYARQHRSQGKHK